VRNYPPPEKLILALAAAAATIGVSCVFPREKSSPLKFMVAAGA